MNGSRYIAEQIKDENKKTILNKANNMTSQHHINIMHEKQLLNNMRLNDNDHMANQVHEQQ